MHVGSPLSDRHHLWCLAIYSELVSVMELSFDKHAAAKCCYFLLQAILTEQERATDNFRTVSLFHLLVP